MAELRPIIENEARPSEAGDEDSTRSANTPAWVGGMASSFFESAGVSAIVGFSKGRKTVEDVEEALRTDETLPDPDVTRYLAALAGGPFHQMHVAAEAVVVLLKLSKDKKFESFNCVEQLATTWLDFKLKQRNIQREEMFSVAEKVYSILRDKMDAYRGIEEALNDIRMERTETTNDLMRIRSALGCAPVYIQLVQSVS